MSAQRHVFADPALAAEACAARITGLLEQALGGREFATLAVSGGRTPQLLFEKMARLKFSWERVHLFWVDERCVPPHDPASNYKLARDAFLQVAHIPERNVHRILGEIAPKEAAQRYAEEIRRFFGLGASEMPQFDIAQCGMGPDAHTASLFPGEALIDDREGIAAAVFAPQFKQWRVTLLPGPLLAAKNLVYLVSGADKAEVLRAVFQEPLEPRKYPAQLIGRGAEWFLDEAAAGLL
ncbi:MAG TPA: 6-phosphogluconolactonase [Bryobacteraceae bacterium]|nr:6-phosphogluconolactonase [Bryobacteraceae bacterium]